MKCPYCESTDCRLKSVEVTTKIKFRVIVFTKESTVCFDCDKAFITPTQVDKNHKALNIAYKTTLN